MSVRAVRAASLALLATLAACEKPAAPPIQVRAAPPVTATTPMPLTQDEPQLDPQLAKSLLALSDERTQPLPGDPIQRPTRPRMRPKRQRPQKPIIDDAYEAREATKLSDAQFQAALGSWRGVRACLAQVGQRSTPEGALKVAFTISGEGDVVGSKVYDLSSEHAEEMADCVEREAKRVRFPAFAAAEPVTKEAKFVF